MNAVSFASAQLAVAQLDFSLGLIRDLSTKAATTQDSLVLSPLSVAIALSMVYAGARDETRRELGALLTGGNENAMNETAVLNFFGAMVDRMAKFRGDKTKDSTMIFETASQLFVNHDVRIADAYKRLMEKHFMGALEPVDFLNASATSKAINAFIAEKTHGKISDIVTPDAIDPMTKLMLITAVHFTGKWLYKFNPQATAKSTFYVSECLNQEADMMRLDERLPYFQNDMFQVLVMPYIEEGATTTKRNTRMVVVLPRERYGLPATLDALNGSALLEFVRWTYLRQVSIPKFRIESAHNFVKSLRRMGVRAMFNDESNLDGMVSNIKETAPLTVDKVFQKAFIEVDEHGSVADAVTAIRVVGRSMPLQPAVFVANHPFAFFIVSDLLAEEQRPAASPLRIHNRKWGRYIVAPRETPMKPLPQVLFGGIVQRIA